VTQVAEMPDGRTYFWVARTSSTSTGGFLSTPKSFAIGLGCDIAHAHRLVYSTGIAIDDPSTAVPIGPGCKVCVRDSCAQRAFPYIGRSVHVDEDASSRLPYT
jgi:predicted transcriptional regulator